VLYNSSEALLKER
jgi:hypothetical protein